ncbi:hypothetical protein [Thiohalophilus sp.]|nr:hypothetical protein [Thiohalophilus sp.]MDZ7805338.1 hypothetical protein [Thiohalophilus sp.]
MEDALKEGYPVLMIEARDKAEAEDAYKLMQSTMRIDEVKY